MNILTGIAMIAIGIAVDAFYKHRERKMEADAYVRGYKHAKAECDIFKEGVSEGRMQEMFRNIPNQPLQPRKIEISEAFLDEARQNGHATVKLQ